METTERGRLVENRTKCVQVERHNLCAAACASIQLSGQSSRSLRLFDIYLNVIDRVNNSIIDCMLCAVVSLYWHLFFIIITTYIVSARPPSVFPVPYQIFSRHLDWAFKELVIKTVTRV